MRVCILVLSLLGFLAIADTANAGLSTANRDLSLLEPASMTDEANQETEDRIGLDKERRRDVQRQLTGLGFDTKVDGTFNESNSCRHHALAGRTRLSENRLFQYPGARGLADRSRRDGARQLQRQIR